MLQSNAKLQYAHRAVHNTTQHFWLAVCGAANDWIFHSCHILAEILHTTLSFFSSWLGYVTQLVSASTNNVELPYHVVDRVLIYEGTIGQSNTNSSSTPLMISSCKRVWLDLGSTITSWEGGPALQCRWLVLAIEVDDLVASHRLFWPLLPEKQKELD